MLFMEIKKASQKVKSKLNKQALPLTVRHSKAASDIKWGKKWDLYSKGTQKLPVVRNIIRHCENSFPCLALNFFHLRTAFQIYIDTLKIPTKQKLLFI